MYIKAKIMNAMVVVIIIRHRFRDGVAGWI